MDSTLRFQVDGMTCGGCARAVRQALEALPGVAVEQVLVGEPVSVQIDSATANRDDVEAAVEQAGFRPRFAS